MADEEDGSEGAGMRWLVEARPDLATDYVVNEGAAERLELADGRVIATVTVGEKGATQARITAHGDEGPSTLPGAGVNAVPRLAALLSRLDAYVPERAARARDASAARGAGRPVADGPAPTPRSPAPWRSIPRWPSWWRRSSRRPSRPRGCTPPRRST